MRPASLAQELGANVDLQQGVAARNTSAESGYLRRQPAADSPESLEQNTRITIGNRQVMRAASPGQELGTNVDVQQAVTTRNT